MGGVVIVGGGHAGYQCADSLRRAGFEGAVTVVDGEGHLPYQRPPLSKSYLLSDTTEEALLFRTPEYYADHNITLKTGRRVVAIHRADKQVELDDGERLDYEHLVLATGARLRRLDLPGADLDGVGYIKSLDDIRYIQSHLEDAEAVVVIGGGFIALEFAATAAKLGKQVTVLVRGQRLMANAVSPEISAYMLDVHHQHGVDIRFGTEVDHIASDEQGKVEAVRLKDGTLLSAQLVLAGIGVEADTELAIKAKLLCHDGVVVDAQCRTSDPAIFAAGDSAKFDNPFAGRPVRLESVQNAVDQAKVIAQVIAGQEASYHAVPWFWSDQYEIKLQMAGLHDGYTDLHQRGSREEDKFSLLFYRDGKLIALHSVNRPADHMAGRKLITAGISPTPEQAQDVGFKLNTLVKKK